MEEEISTTATLSGMMERGQANGGKCRRQGARTLIRASSGRKWHTLVVEEQLVDIRAVCPQDVKKFLN